MRTRKFKNCGICFGAPEDWEHWFLQEQPQLLFGRLCGDPACAEPAKKCPPHWSYPVQKVLQPCFPALGKCQLLVVAPISKPCCLLSQEKARRLCVGGKGTHGKAWLFLPFCRSALMHLSLQQLLWVLWLQGSEQTLQSLSKASLSAV